MKLDDGAVNRECKYQGGRKIADQDGRLCRSYLGKNISHIDEPDGLPVVPLRPAAVAGILEPVAPVVVSLGVGGNGSDAGSTRERKEIKIFFERANRDLCRWN